MFITIVYVIVGILIIAGPFIYGSLWKEKVTNKSTPFFSVAKVEKNVLTVGKYLVLVIDLLWITYMIEMLHNVFMKSVELRIGGLCTCFVFFLIWHLTMSYVLQRKHRCLPMSAQLDVKDMIQSIEQEQFSQIREQIWHSKNWIRISYRFYPKNGVLGIRQTTGGSDSSWTILVYGIDGKVYENIDGISVLDKQLEGDILTLEATLPIGEAIMQRGQKFRGRLQENKWSKNLFDSYMKEHSTIEFIQNRELINEVIRRTDT